MHSDADVKIITINPKYLTLTAALITAVSTGISECSQDGYVDVCINDDNGAFEIIAQKIREYEISALPAMVLTDTTVSLTRKKSDLIKNYNRAQNAKYNVSLRNYKGRKR